MNHEPTFAETGGVSTFRCPFDDCGTVSLQRWHREVQGNFSSLGNVVTSLHFCKCDSCNKVSVWQNGAIIHPRSVAGPPPNGDLNQDIQDDFEEARRIVSDSPRGAAALLRLCVQKICKQLGEPGENINQDIKSLVSKGLSETLQRSLDIVRVTGNESVHPGQMDLKDDRDTALQLFGLVNIIAETMISEPKRIEKLYQSLPQSKRQQIEERDKKTQPAGGK